MVYFQQGIDFFCIAIVSEFKALVEALNIEENRTKSNKYLLYCSTGSITTESLYSTSSLPLKTCRVRWKDRARVGFPRARDFSMAGVFASPIWEYYVSLVRRWKATPSLILRTLYSPRVHIRTERLAVHFVTIILPNYFVVKESYGLSLP